MWSTYKGHTEIVKLLLEWGANLHLTVSVRLFIRQMFSTVFVRRYFTKGTVED